MCDDGKTYQCPALVAPGIFLCKPVAIQQKGAAWYTLR